MTSELTPEDRDFLAGEYVLGLLEGEDLLRARALLARDPAFAGEVAFWEDCFSPLFDVAPERPAPATVWPAVAAQIAQPMDGSAGGSGNGGASNVIDLQRRLTRWRGIASLAMAAAASLVLVLLVGPALREPVAPTTSETETEAARPMLAANIPIADTPLRLALTYVPERDSVTVSASGLAPDGVHDHELWLIDRQGGLHSLGVVVPGAETSHSVPAELEPELQPGARLVLTREPLGGKPEGMDAGPVVAEGQFNRI